MPKDRRKRVGGHDPSVKLDNAVEHVDVGAAAEESAADVLDAMDEDPRAPTLKKKEKQQLKRDALLQRLESNHSPYSKSHARRQKRRAKEQIAGGLDDMQLALAAVEDEAADAEAQDSMPAATDDSAPIAQPKKKAKPKPGQIGEGKGAPLSRSQRQRALELEKLRHPLILANSDFSSNPFQTIRTHAQNTLVQH
ncbi:ribosome biogenesis protein SLX9-domain-containing protein [Mycena rebaudengoi]|nr:ribosome biogenesis protein SLX9-domain-containing protein [Mycena rebaudengoi]